MCLSGTKRVRITCLLSEGGEASVEIPDEGPEIARNDGKQAQIRGDRHFRHQEPFRFVEDPNASMLGPL